MDAMQASNHFRINDYLKIDHLSFCTSVCLLLHLIRTECVEYLETSNLWSFSLRLLKGRLFDDALRTSLSTIKIQLRLKIGQNRTVQLTPHKNSLQLPVKEKDLTAFPSIKYTK